MIRNAKEGDVLWLVRNCKIKKVTFESGNVSHRFVMVRHTGASCAYGVFLYELFRKKTDAKKRLLKVVRESLAEEELHVESLRSQLAELEEETSCT